MALELTVTFAVAILTPGHSLLHDYISTTGATDAPHQELFMASGIVAALLHLTFVSALIRRASDPWMRRAAYGFAGFFVFLGIGLAFQCDPGCALETTEAWIHFWFGVAAFVSLGVAGIITAVRAWNREHVLAGLAVALVVFDVLLLASDLTKVFQGITERATILAMMAWSVRWGLRPGLAAPGSPATPTR